MDCEKFNSSECCGSCHEDWPVYKGCILVLEGVVYEVCCSVWSDITEE